MQAARQLDFDGDISGTSAGALIWGGAATAGKEKSPRALVAIACERLLALQRGELIDPATGDPFTLGSFLGDCLACDAGVYLAPEMVRGQAPDERSLVFALGVLLFERITAQHPFGKTREVRLARLRRGELGSSATQVPQMPVRLRSILLRAMGPFPEARYHSLEALIDDLQRFAGVRGMLAAATVARGRTTTDSGARRAEIVIGQHLRAERPAGATDDTVDGASGSSRRGRKTGPGAVAPAASGAGASRRAQGRAGRWWPTWARVAASFVTGAIVAAAVSGWWGPWVRTRLGRSASAAQVTRDRRLPVDSQHAVAGRQTSTATTVKRTVSSERPRTLAANTCTARQPAERRRVVDREVTRGSVGKRTGVHAGRVDRDKRRPSQQLLRVADELALVARRCGVPAEGRAVRLALRFAKSGRVVHAYASGDLTSAHARCVTDALRGELLDVSLPRDRSMAWELRLRPGSAAARLLRPAGAAREFIHL